MHRVAHALWKNVCFCSLVSYHTLVDGLRVLKFILEPQIGRRFFIDHGMGVVIGETAEIGDDVLMYKGVVLGGVSLDKAKAAPDHRNGVVIGSNTIVLGPIEIGA